MWPAEQKPAVFAKIYTINDKSFEGEKFRGLLGSSGMWVSQFFPSLPSYIHGFPTLQNIYERFTKALCSSHEFSLKLSLAFSEMDKSTLLTRVCTFHALIPGWPCSHRRRRATVEVSPRWNRSLTTSLLASSASY